MAPVTFDVNVTGIEVPAEQIVCVSGVLVTAGFGLMVMGTFTGIPRQVKPLFV